jgi:hypothetical protein
VLGVNRLDYPETSKKKWILPCNLEKHDPLPCSPYALNQTIICAEYYAVHYPLQALSTEFVLFKMGYWDISTGTRLTSFFKRP